MATNEELARAKRYFEELARVAKRLDSPNLLRTAERLLHENAKRARLAEWRASLREVE